MYCPEGRLGRKLDVTWIVVSFHENWESIRTLECWALSNQQPALDIRQPQFHDFKTTPTSLRPSPSNNSNYKEEHRINGPLWRFLLASRKGSVDQQEINTKISKFRRLHPVLNLRLCVQQLSQPIWTNSKKPWHKLPVSLRNPIVISNKRDLWCFRKKSSREHLARPNRTLRSAAIACFNVSRYFWGILIFRLEILHMRTRYFINRLITKKIP